MQCGDVLRSMGVGPRPLAASDAAPQAPGRQRTASSASSTAPPSTESDADLSDSNTTGIDGSDRSDSSMSPDLLADGPSLPPAMVLLEDIDQEVEPFAWRHTAAPSSELSDFAPRAQSSGSSENTSASVVSSHKSPRRPSQRRSLSPLSPLTASSAPWRQHGSFTRSSTSDELEGVSRQPSSSSLWRSAAISYAPTPAVLESLSPVDFGSPSHSPSASSFAALPDASYPHAPRTPESARPKHKSAHHAQAVDAADIAGALAQLPRSSKRPSLSLSGLPTASTGAASDGSPVSALQSIPWVDHSPEATDDVKASPWAKHETPASFLTSPVASTSRRSKARSDSASSLVSVASDILDPQLMAQSMMSTTSVVSQVSQQSAVSTETRRLSSWHGQQLRRVAGDKQSTNGDESDLTKGHDDLSARSSISSVGNDSNHVTSESGPDQEHAHGSEFEAALSDEEDASPHAQFSAERIACANAAAAGLRSLLLPTPLTHVHHCLSRGRDHLAVVTPSDEGTSVLQVLWLGASERVLGPVPAASQASRVPLRWGLSIAPPLGQRGAVKPPVVGQYGFDEPAGCELLAANFSDDDPPKTIASQSQQQYVMGFVTASGPHGPEQASQVVWHSGPGSLHQWRQPLMAVRAPQVLLSPNCAALALVSATPKAGPFGVSRILDGVWLYVMRRVMVPNPAEGPDGMREERYWVLRQPESLMPAGSLQPTFAWAQVDQLTVMVSDQGVRVLDTHLGKLHQELHLPLPEALVVPGAQVAAGAVSFDPEERNMAVNWSTIASSGEVLRRLGRVVILDTSRAAAQPTHSPTPRPAEIWTTAPPPNPYEMIHFIGDRGDALWARADDTKVIFRPKPDQSPNLAKARQYGGATETYTRAHKHQLLPIGGNQTFVAMVSPKKMRLYISYGPVSRPAERRFPFADKQRAVMEALQERGIEPSPNRLTLEPWIESKERFMYLGFDDAVVQRYDLAPNEGRQPPVLVQPKQQGVATYHPQKTHWLPTGN